MYVKTAVGKTEEAETGIWFDEKNDGEMMVDVFATVQLNQSIAHGVGGNVEACTIVEGLPGPTG